MSNLVACIFKPENFYLFDWIDSVICTRIILHHQCWGLSEFMSDITKAQFANIYLDPICASRAT